MGCLATVAMGSRKGLSAGANSGTFYMFSGDFICYLFLRQSFYFKERIKDDQNQWASCLFVLLFFTCPFLLLPNSEIKCLALRGEVRVRFSGFSYDILGFIFLWYTLVYHY
jgi:hypothetical protein